MQIAYLVPGEHDMQGQPQIGRPVSDALLWKAPRSPSQIPSLRRVAFEELLLHRPGSSLQSPEVHRDTAEFLSCCYGQFRLVEEVVPRLARPAFVSDRQR